VDPNRRPTATAALADPWLTTHAADSTVDLGHGLRKNFNARKEWKNAILKVRIANAFTKVTPLKDGRTTSDEEDCADDEDQPRHPKTSLQQQPQGRTDLKAVTSQQPRISEGTASIRHRDRETVRQTAERTEGQNGPPHSGWINGQTSGSSVAREEDKRSTPNPLVHQSRHDDDGSDNDGDQSWGLKSMPGSFSFGTPGSPQIERENERGGGGGGGDNGGDDGGTIAGLLAQLGIRNK